MDIDRLEELFIKYNFGNSFVTAGKQLINTPFINLQDGRMRPTEVSGLWTEINKIRNLKIEGGFLNQISPRGTVKWYNVKESIGVYSSGLNKDGSKSNYAGNIYTKGFAMIGLKHKTSKNLSLKFWNLNILVVIFCFLKLLIQVSLPQYVTARINNLALRNPLY